MVLQVNMSIRKSEFLILHFHSSHSSGRKKWSYLAEEMRILYVAMTRAKEKLILIGSVKNAEKEKENG